MNRQIQQPSSTVATALARAIAELEGEEPYCDICDRFFDDVTSLAQHLASSSAHRRGDYECENCFQTFRTEDDRDEHWDNSPECDPGFKCDFCPRVFRTEGALEQHEQSNSANCRSSHQDVIHEFSCKDCNRVFSSQAALIQHLDNSPAHNPRFESDEDDYDHYSEEDNDQYCDFCDRYFDDEQALTQHVRDSPAHWDETYCELCDRYFSNEVALTLHMRDSPAHISRSLPAPSVSMPQRAITTGTGPIKTDTVTAKQIPNPLATRVLNLASTPNPVPKVQPNTSQCYNCPTCSRSFATKEALKQHTDNAQAHRPYDCEVCHRSFESKNALEQHTRDAPAHSNTFDCNMCRRTFSSKKALASHVQNSQAHQDPTGKNAMSDRKYRVLQH